MCNDVFRRIRLGKISSFLLYALSSIDCRVVVGFIRRSFGTPSVGISLSLLLLIAVDMRAAFRSTSWCSGLC